MTIPSTARKAGPLLGTGAQTAWPFTFKVFAAGDVAVTIANSAGVETILVLDTDYTVLLNANQETSPGGTVTYPIAGTPLATGSVISIIGDLDYDQPLDLPSGGNFSPFALENQLDRQVMQIQQLREAQDRAISVPVTDTGTEPLTFPTRVDRAGRVLGFDASGNMAVFQAGTGTPYGVARYQYTATEGQTAFVTGSSYDVGFVDVFADGLKLVTGVDYTASDGSTVSLTVGATAGTEIEVVCFGTVILSSLDTVSTHLANIDTVAENIADVNTVADNIADVNTVADNIAAISDNAASIATVAADIAGVNNVSDAITNGDLLTGVYQGAHATNPTLRLNGAVLQNGDIYFNTATTRMTAYASGTWYATETEGATDAALVSYTGPNAELATVQDLAGDDGASLVGYLPAGTGAVATTVQSKLRESVSVNSTAPVGDGVANDLVKVQAAFNSGAVAISVPPGTYNLGGGTLTIPANMQVYFTGGKFTNGTIACNNTYFDGVSGMTSSITLTGTINSTVGVIFDWFECEKSTSAQYNTFINGNNATYGAIPAIAQTNKTILNMLFSQGHTVKFGQGIYPFDASVPVTGSFRISGLDRSETLIWSPNSAFISMTTGGATYPYIKNITIESNNSCIYTQANTVNAIHGILLTDSFFISYADHAFNNDATIAGGTGCPIYGAKISNCAVYAGAGKGCFTNWFSGSNIYDNVVDLHVFFNDVPTNKKGIPKALFYNSNVRDYCNSNIAYAGTDYVAYFDKPSVSFIFNAHNNVFETGTYAFQAIAKADAPSSNISLDIGSNQYIGNVSKETGYAYIFNVGNTYVRGCQDEVVISGNQIRNFSKQYVRVVTPKIDSSGTKYRLQYHEPNASDESGNSLVSPLTTPSAGLSALIGMGSIYAADSANISYIQIFRSRRSVNGNALGGLAYGTTALRPTSLLQPSHVFFDTTLGKPIWWNGAVWNDATGTTV